MSSAPSILDRRLPTLRRWPFGVALALAALASAAFIPDAALRTATVYGVVYAVSLTGLNVLVGASGAVSLGHVSFYAIGAVLTGALGAAGLTWGIAALLSTAASCLFGAALGLPALRLDRAPLALGTLGFALVVVGFLQGLPEATGGPGEIDGIPRPAVLGDDSLRAYYAFCVIVAIPVVVLGRNIFWSQTGRRLRAIRDDSTAAVTMGIPRRPAMLGTFVFTAACAGFAGSLFAGVDGTLTPDDFSQADSLFFLAALVIGGVSAPTAGPVAGGIGMALLVYASDRWLPDDTVLLVAIVFLAFLAVAPAGIGGLLRRTPLERLLPGPSDTLLAHARARLGIDPGKLSTLEPVASRPPIVEVGPAASAGSGRRVAHPAGDVRLRRAPVLELADVSKSFGGISALDRVSLRVDDGTIHALMGPNGGGKTTVLDVVSGLVDASSGTVRFGGDPITDVPAHLRARAGIGRAFEDVRLFSSLSALENCLVGMPSSTRLGQQVLGSPRARAESVDAAEVALGLLDALGLRDVAGRRASDLSFGERKLLALARAASLRPRLLLLDEPSAGLDPAGVGAMVDALRILRRSGFTMLLVEHHQDLIATLSNTVTVLDRGTVIAQGPAARVQRDPAVVEVYLGASHTDAPGTGSPGTDAPGTGETP